MWSRFSQTFRIGNSAFSYSSTRSTVNVAVFPSSHRISTVSQAFIVLSFLKTEPAPAS